ncbi:MAG: transcription-repair coupling factor, partial [Acidimicrobiia bacterium]
MPTETRTNAPLRSLPGLLAEHPAVRAVVGRQPVVAVPQAARAIFVASVADATRRRPILVAVATAAEAERLAHDLPTYLGADEHVPLPAIELFPAWETLPFERVSPNLETMSRRLRVTWRLRTGRHPDVVVAPVRALVQRLGPHVGEIEPAVVQPGDRVDREELVASLVAGGYRREYQVEARGEVAVRGSIVDVYPATDDHPVRIDLWGDEVDRLSSFSVADQRSTDDRGEVWLFPARELLPTPDVRARAEALVRSEPWGREQWERLAEGQLFDGMESWLPWLAGDDRLLPDLLPEDGLVLAVEPRRARDRARDLVDEELALGETLAVTWGDRPDRDRPHLTLSFDRVLAETPAGTTSVVGAPEGPDTPHLAATTFDPVGGGADLASRLRSLQVEGYRVLVAADGAGSAGRLNDVLAEEGAAAVEVVVAPLERGVVIPPIRLAVVGEGDLTGRRRVHRRARG